MLFRAAPELIGCWMSNTDMPPCLGMVVF